MEKEEAIPADVLASVLDVQGDVQMPIKLTESIR